MRSEDLRRHQVRRPRLEQTLFRREAPSIAEPAERDLEVVSAELRDARKRLNVAERKLGAIDALDGIDRAAVRAATSHVTLIGRPSGYVLAERDEPPPAVGDAREWGAESFVVERLVASPLPGDRRRCAILVPSRVALRAAAT